MFTRLRNAARRQLADDRAKTAASDQPKPALQDAGGTPENLLDRLDRIDERLEALLYQLRVNALGPEREFSFLFRDHLIRMHLPFADVDGIQRHILRGRTFYEHKELSLAASYISPGSVVLDAGANIGNHTIFFAAICAAREVVAVEVMRTTFGILQRNVELNKLTNVRLLNVGLGARPGYANLERMRMGNIGATTIKTADAPAPYQIVTIDSLSFDRLDFVKIDVEGTFLEVLEGGRETIARCRPLIWIELRPKYNEWEPGERALTRMGYRVERRLSGTNFLFAPG